MNDKLALSGGKPVLGEQLPEPIYIKEPEIEAALQVLKTGKLSGFVARPGEEFYGGPWVKKLEKCFRDHFECRHAISVNSATSGLFAAVYALNLQLGDEVIVPPYTMSASVSAVLAASAVPVFADISPENFCLDPVAVERAITARTKAIMVVHLFGNVADMDGIKKIAIKHGLKIIEDCAQAPGAKYHGKYAGTLGDIGVFSFNRHKTIQTGEGGVIVTDDEELAFRLQLIRNHGEEVADKMGLGDKYHLIGWNYRMTELEAAIASVQITRLTKLNEIRINNANYLEKKLKQFKWIIPNRPQPNSVSVYYRYPFRYLKQELGIGRATLAKALAAEGFSLNEGYIKPLYLQAIYQNKGDLKSPYLSELSRSGRDYSRGVCPVVERLYQEEFLFTAITHLARNNGDIDSFIEALGKIESNVGELIKYEQKA